MARPLLRPARRGYATLRYDPTIASLHDDPRFAALVKKIVSKNELGQLLCRTKAAQRVQVAVAYLVAGWALAQGLAQVLPVFSVPNWVIQLVVVLIVLGLPVALGLAWAFELTPEGIKRTETADAMPEATRRKKYVWIYVVVIGGLLSIGLFFLGRYSAAPTQHAAVDTSVKSIAVLPFENLSDDKQNTYFADGVQDQILTNLARVSDLRVISHTTVRQYKSGEPRNLREIGRQLGVTHILEGSVQRAGDRLRIAAQLIDARTDSQIGPRRTIGPLPICLRFRVSWRNQSLLSSRRNSRLNRRPTSRRVQLRIWLRSSFTFAPSKSWTAI